MQLRQYFHGESGRKYEFTIYPINNDDTPYKDGVYIFVKRNTDSWGIIYIGEASNLWQRIYLNLDNHQAWKSGCIQQNGATHVAIYEVSGDEQKRIDIETDLRHNYPKSPCNKQ